ncbi:hypothetical protein P691DRAFT_656416, partial [Macrolepiota fuliginosa MF-IS2]
PMENPPPYTVVPQRSGTITRDPPSPSKPIVAPAASVSQVHVFSRKEDIVENSGTFHVDPQTPAHGDGPTIQTRYGRKKRGKGKKKGTVEAPHASFQTRKGDIKLQLATASSARAGDEREERANVFVGSRCGKIEVTMVSSDPRQPYIGLDVFSRSGDVVVYVPETFSGVIRVESAKGEMRFLPALAGGMRVLKSTERETMVTLGDGQGDLCEVFTRSGRIVLGLAGRDEYREEAGFWQKLFLRK